jgi:hypothetical protein
MRTDSDSTARGTTSQLREEEKIAVDAHIFNAILTTSSFGNILFQKGREEEEGPDEGTRPLLREGDRGRPDRKGRQTAPGETK